MAVTITRPGASVARNTVQTIPWSGITHSVYATTRADWFGLYDLAALDYEPTLWQLTDGSAAGSVPLFLPPGLAAISYELRLFSGHTNAKLATSATFTVTGGTAPTITAPAAAQANDTISVTWSGIGDPQPTDFFVLSQDLHFNGPASAPVSTGGAAAGTASLYIPNATPPGQYDVYLFRAAIPAYDLPDLQLALSTAIVVTGAPVPTIASPGDQLAGTLVAAQWANIVSPAPTVQDWVGIFALGAPASAPLGNRYLNGTASGSLPFVIPGYLPTASYELRLYSGADQSLLATSAAFTVTAAP